MVYYISAIMLLPFNSAPLDALLCDGREYPITLYEPLYTIIRNTYGGSYTSNTFAVPNMLGMEPIKGMNYYIVTIGYFPA
jgi:microcystin-dependent protein